MNELKNCPFCGGKAEYDEREISAWCHKCGATIMGKYKIDVIQSWDIRHQADIIRLT